MIKWDTKNMTERRKYFLAIVILFILEIQNIGAKTDTRKLKKKFLSQPGGKIIYINIKYYYNIREI